MWSCKQRLEMSEIYILSNECLSVERRNNESNQNSRAGSSHVKSVVQYSIDQFRCEGWKWGAEEIAMQRYATWVPAQFFLYMLVLPSVTQHAALQGPQWHFCFAWGEFHAPWVHHLLQNTMVSVQCLLRRKAWGVGWGWEMALCSCTSRDKCWLIADSSHQLSRNWWICLLVKTSGSEFDRETGEMWQGRAMWI